MTTEVSINGRNQSVTIADIVSEGEINGLVDGANSIFLDGTPITSSEEQPSGYTTNYLTQQKVFFGDIGSGTSSGADNVLTCLAPYTNVFAGLTETGRYVRIIGAGKKLTNGASASAGSTVITTNSSFFASGDVSVGSVGPSGNFFRIEGVGENNTTYVGRVVEYVSATEVVVSPAIDLAFSNKTIAFDHISTVSSYDSNGEITISDNVVTEVESALGLLYATNITGSSEIYDESDTNFNNVAINFVTGRRDQNFVRLLAPGNVTGSSFNDAIEQYSGFTGGGYGGSGSALELSKEALSDLSLAAPSEVDELKVTLMFPAMYRVNTKEGDEYHSRAEFQIYFDIKRNSTWIETNDGDPIFGPTDATILSRNVNSHSGYTTAQVDAFEDFRYAPAGSNNGMVINKTKKRFVKDFSWDIEKYKPFDDFRVRIRRVTTDELKESDDQNFHQSYLVGIYSIIHDKLNYPLTAIGSVKFNSSEFQNIPVRAYECEGMLLQVPTNYNPEDRTYTRNVTTGVDEGTYQAWDGKFRGDLSEAAWREDASHPNYRKVYSNNPAWVYYDILTNNRYGLGSFLEAQDIDKYALYQIARYCDELVPDGNGGLEPRFTCNLYITNHQDAYKILSDIASIFRSILVWTQGQVTTIQDRPKEPIYTFTKGNVIDGKFSYQTSSSRNRVNQVKVTWNNPNRFYKAQIEIVEDTENIVETGRIVEDEIVAMGCTSQGQAHRLGKWKLLTEKLENSFISFTTGINAGFLRPGEIVYVQDSDSTNVVYSGRVSNTGTRNTTTIPLDRSVTLDSGNTYDLHLIYPKGGCYLQEDGPVTINSNTYYRGDLILQGDVEGETGTQDIDSKEFAANLIDDSGNAVQTYWTDNSRVETQRVSTSSGTVSSLTVSSAFSATPNAEVVWSLTKIDAENIAETSQKYRIISIQENEGTYDISAQKYYEDKFDAIDRDFDVYVRSEEPVPNYTEAVPAPESVTLSFVPQTIAGPTEYVNPRGVKGYKAQISWQAPRDPEYPSRLLYRFASAYEIEHNITDDGEPIRELIDRTAGSIHTIYNINSGGYYVKIRTINTIGQHSKWAYIRKTFDERERNEDTSMPQSIVRLKTGGDIETYFSFDPVAGSVTFETDTYDIVGPAGNSYSISGGTTSFDFSGLSDGESGYLVFDSENEDFSILKLYTDEIVESNAGDTIDYQYWMELGASNNGLTEVTGTCTVDITETINSVSQVVWQDRITVSGRGSALSDDFSPGDLVKLGASSTSYQEDADDWYGTVVGVNGTTQIDPTQPVNKAFSGDKIYKASKQINFNKDFIVLRVDRVNSTTYKLRTYAKIRQKPNLSYTVTNLNAKTKLDIQGGEGGVPDYTGTGFSVKVYQDGSLLNYADPVVNNSFKVSVSATGVTTGSPSTSGGNVRTYADLVGMSGSSGTVDITITAKDRFGIEHVFTETQNINKDSTSVLPLLFGDIHQGGLVDFAFTINSDSSGVEDSDPGEIYLSNGPDHKFWHPDGDLREFSFNVFTTPVEGIGTGFDEQTVYIMWTETTADTRFSTITITADVNLCCVIYKPDEQKWYAISSSCTGPNDTDELEEFTPAATDCIIASIRGDGTNGDIKSISTIATVNQFLLENGDFGLKNPNFELGDVFWIHSDYSSIVRDPSNADTGNWVLKIEFDNVANAGPVYNEGLLPVEPGELVVARGRGRRATGSQSIGNIKIQFLDDTLTEVDVGGGVTLANSTDWLNLRSAAEVPAGASYARLFVRTNRTASTNHVFYFDNFSLRVEDSIVVGGPRLYNGSFEDGDAFWVFTNGWLGAAEENENTGFNSARTGNAFAIKQGNPSAGLAVSNRVQLTGSGADLSAWFYVEDDENTDAFNGDVVLKARYFDRADTFISDKVLKTLTSAEISADEWLSISEYAPPNEINGAVAIAVVLEVDNTDGYFYLDGVDLKPRPAPTASTNMVKDPNFLKDPFWVY